MRALQQQHEAALEGERQRVEKIQSELDAYAAQRENLFAARMDFLQHGESTFKDWTDTLESFAGNDLVRGKQAFEAFSDSMDDLNDAINQSRLKLDPTQASVQYNVLQRIQNQPKFTPTRGSLPTDKEQAALLSGADSQELGLTAEQVRNFSKTEAAASLANVIEKINADVAVINASITSIETQISQASEPAEIAALLEQIPALIETKYQRLRDALDARFNAGEISVDVYNASLSELDSGESAELEANSDALLANVVRMIDEDIGLIDASITDIETQIAGLSDPEAIAELLSQIPGLITEKYTRLREALDAKYAAGELSVDVYNASLSLLSSGESGEMEQQSDAVLAQDAWCD